MTFHNAGSVLMLDDEYDIMSILILALERQGFHVIGFTEPLLALDHFQKNSERYWLVVADIRMPLIDGYQFIKRVMEVKPDDIKKYFLCRHSLPTIFNIEQDIVSC